jgi:hypothetical protein
VGYRNYTHVEGGSGTKDDPYKAKENSNATDKEFRQAYYRYGSGVARTDVYGGRIHNVYGGSNEKGNISEMALSVYEKASTCESIIDKTYGAGKNAEIDGEVGFCPAWKVDVIDTTGAGDSFFAGVAIGLTYGKTLGESCVIGTRLAASVIATKENVCPRFLPEEFGLTP